MTTYRFTNLENSFIAADGIGVFPANEDSYLYREMVEQGITPEPYNAPPEPALLTTEEKIQNAGFTLGELEEYLVGKIQQRLND